ncbi:MAG: PadR family transcriptional regulator [Cyanobacteria bacterium P01_F01_bin.143]
MANRKKKPIKLSSIDEDLLTVLLGRELYGLEMLDYINPDRPGLPLTYGSIYPALNRLEKKGLIESRWGDESKGSSGARRKYYKVTGLGASCLSDVQNYRLILAQRPSFG